jgi:hypothetical protein
MGRGQLPGVALALLLTAGCAVTTDETGQTGSSGRADAGGLYRPVDDPSALCRALDFSPLVGDTGGAAPTAEPQSDSRDTACANSGDKGALRVFVAVFDDENSARERFRSRGEPLPGLGDDAWAGVPARAGGPGPEVHARFANLTVRALLWYDPAPGGSADDYRETHARLADVARAVEEQLSKG